MQHYDDGNYSMDQRHGYARPNTIADFVGYLLVAYGPWPLTSNCSTAFGRWCVSHAGAWAYHPMRYK